MNVFRFIFGALLRKLRQETDANQHIAHVRTGHPAHCAFHFKFWRVLRFDPGSPHLDKFQPAF
jgi:hypothetical protein